MSSYSLLSLRSVAEIAAAKLKFFIPDYQRGYRWEEPQVKDLLEDLAIFFGSEKPLYCLQPLVVVPRDGGEWEVVDGQQRLTTLFLILSQLPGETPGFEIRYQRHERHFREADHTLSAILQREEDADEKIPDLHYVRAAANQIAEFLMNHPKGQDLRNLAASSPQAVSFIWYQLPHGDAIDAFTRLNAGKIPLTDVELIRALFLSENGELTDTERLQVAAAWDQMESRLNEAEFWSFAAPVGDNPVNRIELLFQMVAGRKLDQEDHELFQNFERRIRNRGAKKTWEDVEDAFSALAEWHGDHTLFHLIGYLSNADKAKDVAVWNLYHGYWLSKMIATKAAFGKALRGRIKEQLIGSQKIQDFIDGLRYDGQSDLKSPLLCFNLASLLTERDGTVRFSFAAFRSQKWDVEHIHALATGEPKGKDLEGFLEMYRNFFERHPADETKALLERLTNAMTSGAKTSPAIKSELYGECRRHDPEDERAEEREDENALGNLTLLDAITNRGYKNASFRVKRAWILDPRRQNIYVPPCTRNVFTKSYTPKAPDLLRWNPGDAEAYKFAMRELLENFFQDTVPLAPAPVEAVTAKDSEGKRNGKSDAVVPLPDFLPPGESRSFMELLDVYHRIEIPMIQRDYAQGRSSESTATVRAAFLDSIFKTLRDDKPLNLDFVYGTGTKGEVFYPIDGQQRLTTLFLLHWIVFGKAGRLAEFRKAVGKDGFSYAVRPGAARFFPALLDWEPQAVIAGDKGFQNELPEQIWFSRNWRNDPTVRGALVMLDAIHAKLAEGCSPSALVARLGNIQMEVLVLPDSLPADEIYLKMNARGKPLTDFEKFKAWLVGQSLPPEMGHHWKLNLDQKWLEFFWGKSADEKDRARTVSACFFNTILALAINAQAGRDHGGTADQLVGEWINGWIHLKQAYRPDRWEELFDANVIRQVFASLDQLHERTNEIGEFMGNGNWISKDKLVISDPASDLSFTDRCWLHAVTLFCRGKCGADREWFRVARNLIASADPKNVAELPQIVCSLDMLAEHMDPGVLVGLTGVTDDEIGKFRPSKFGDQLREERLKAKLLLADEGTWAAVRDAETHPYLKGQIHVLLEEKPNGSGTVDGEKFAKRWNIFKRLMDRNEMNPVIGDSARGKAVDRLLLRAVLVKCDSLDLEVHQEIILPWMSEDKGWGQKLKRSDNEHVKELQEALLRILDEVAAASSESNGELAARLEEIASHSAPRASEDWMLALIGDGEYLLRDSENWKVRNYRHWELDEAGVILFHKTNRLWADVFIGTGAKARNRLVGELIRDGWLTEDEIPVMSGSYFRRHEILLRRGKGANAWLRIGYRRAVIGGGDPSEMAEIRKALEPITTLVQDANASSYTIREPGGSAGADTSP